MKLRIIAILIIILVLSSCSRLTPSQELPVSDKSVDDKQVTKSNDPNYNIPGQPTQVEGNKLVTFDSQYFAQKWIDEHPDIIIIRISILSRTQGSVFVAIVYKKDDK